MNPHYSLVARRAAHRCEYCHAPEAIFNFPFEVEHILPTSRDGADDETNLCLACRACNLRKSDRVAALDDLSGEDVPLFHPRQQSWRDHFRVDTESGELQGTTPTGRATVASLDLNHPLQLMARLLWIRLRLFP
ncbi:MAG TPA: HNH endonuclease signature motif containing protein [Gemmataceae bacterium]|nr:HNH endonuclease signature motif containing protein [Gemmataceae bacterium]